MELRPNEDFLALIQNAHESAFHLEMRDSYAEPEELAPLRRFLNGEPEPPTAGYNKDDWIGLILSLCEREVMMSRVRVVSIPHSDYQRWLLTVTGTSVAAGEDIRYLPRQLVDPAKIPSDDWWLIDGRQVIFNLIDAHGHPAGAAVTSDPGIAAYCRKTKDQLWELATPYREYVGEFKIHGR